MPASIILGGQWGDEGKGKITDALAPTAAMVVRANGGSNAGPSANQDGTAEGEMDTDMNAGDVSELNAYVALFSSTSYSRTPRNAGGRV